MNEILEHWDFYEPDFYSDLLNRKCDLPKDWIKIFYIARSLFSKNSSFPIKGQIAPLIERKQIFQKTFPQRDHIQSELLFKLNMAESFDIGRINSIHQISHILPREFVVNSESMFYKKLLNRELCTKEFESTDGLSVSELVNGKDRKLNRKQKVYILFDNSYSMNGEKFNKLFAAKSICLEYLRRVQRENPQIYFRFFNQYAGPLLRARTPGEIKDLIRYIIHLNTCECYETRITESILKAVEDIRSDPEFSQAEILMITDGLGDIPANFEEKLGKIKLHSVLISGIDVARFLTQYPDKASWEKANPEMGSKAMPSFWETFLKITQVYRLQEISDIFVRIPSSSLEKFNFSNASELNLLRETRLHLTKTLECGISNREKYEMFQRIKFIIQYLKIMLSKESSPDLKKGIKREINGYGALVKKMMENKWFAYTLESQDKLTQKKTDEPMLYVSGDAKKQWVILFLLNWIIKHLNTLPGTAIKRSCEMSTYMNHFISKAYRKYHLKKRLDHINDIMSKIFVN